MCVLLLCVGKWTVGSSKSQMTIARIAPNAKKLKTEHGHFLKMVVAVECIKREWC